MKKHFGLFAIVFVLSIFAKPALALSCGQGTHISVTLTQDYVCDTSTFLEVLADNVVIDLNGHTITCTSAGGFQGSCQGLSNNYGIMVAGQKNVLVHGPGTISGFGQGIFLGSGTGLSVRGVTITGPSVPKSQDLPPSVVNKRPFSSGIAMGPIHCAFSALAPGFSSVIQYNDISNQTTGITIDQVSCALVASNYVHDNSSGINDSHGVVLFNSSYNLLTANLVVRNGTNQNSIGYPDSGIAVHVDTIGQNPASTGNQIVANDVSNNCGDGIELGNGAIPGGNLVTATNVATNFAMNNSTSTLGGQCRAVAAGTFFDMANRNAGANTWNTNNACKTKLGVPAGVCP